MTGYLSGLAALAVGQTGEALGLPLRPRPRSRYEPSVEEITMGDEEIAEFPFEPTYEETALRRVPPEAPDVGKGPDDRILPTKGDNGSGSAEEMLPSERATKPKDTDVLIALRPSEPHHGHANTDKPDDNTGTVDQDAPRHDKSISEERHNAPVADAAPYDANLESKEPLQVETTHGEADVPRNFEAHDDDPFAPLIESVRTPETVDPNLLGEQTEPATPNNGSAPASITIGRIEVTVAQPPSQPERPLPPPIPPMSPTSPPPQGSDGFAAYSWQRRGRLR
jgi:hypothetical protein